MKTPLEPFDFNRREFLRGGSLASLASLLAGRARGAEDAKPSLGGTAVTAMNTGVIGLGLRGREILASLAQITNARVTAICDHYPSALRRAAALAPGAKSHASAADLIADPNVAAVVIATPTHQHRELVLAALAAGKHVYCEAPVANTIEDSREIARTARKASHLIFQPGLQERSHPQRHFLFPFIRSGGAGRIVKARTQWQKKTSWRSTSPNADREKALNWRLYATTSLGLAGELGIHQTDVMSWYLGRRPVSVLGFGTIQHWKDDRDVADTAQCIVEYPGKVLLSQEFTLVNSFDGATEMMFGTDAAVMMRENKAWMFKESDSPLLGWEVYARKDSFHKELGIALVANATKIAAQGAKPAEEAPYPNPPVYYALEAFLFNAHELVSGTKDFTDNYGTDDPKGLAEHLSKLPYLPAAKWQDGHDATVVAIKSNEAILKGTRIEFRDEWFDVG